jgi:hypothetical protein
MNVLSIVSLKDTPVVIAQEQNFTYILYNAIAHIYNPQLIAPRGHGPFLPAL